MEHKIFDISLYRVERGFNIEDNKGHASILNFEVRKAEMVKRRKKNKEIEKLSKDEEYLHLSHDDKENQLAREIFKGDLLDDELIYLLNEVRKIRSKRLQKTSQ